ncbi:MAG: NYN domain-containing protein [Erysipelotrichaceae bacterium]|nr:NYN domain-containing protein [Erysipelotrichaceae bacterium]
MPAYRLADKMMVRIKKDEIDKVYNSLYKPKERVLPANEKKPRKVDFTSDIKTSKTIIYLVDGYNLMYSIDEIKQIAAVDLLSARDKVIDIVADFQGYVGKKCILVFDAYRNNVPIPIVTREYNIEIVYTKMGQTADMWIEQKAEELGENHKIFVVTSDGLEQLKIFSSSCFRISSSEFMHRYENLQKRHKNTTRNAKHQPLKELRKLLYED